jgi:Lon protease-like protein
LGQVATITRPRFPLGTVLLPGAQLPLRIFEPRYRALIEDVLERTDGAPEFGVVAIRAGVEVGAHGVQSLYEVGCLAEIQHIQPFTDGTFDVMTRGTRRFRIGRVHPPVPDRADRAEIDVLPDEASARSRDLAETATRLFRRYRRTVLSARGFDPDSPFTIPDDPVRCAYLLAAVVTLDLRDRQRLLEAPTVDDRLILLADLLNREIAMIGRSATRAGEELARGPYSPN